MLKPSTYEYILGAISTDSTTGTGIFLASDPKELIGAIAELQLSTLTLSSPNTVRLSPFIPALAPPAPQFWGEKSEIFGHFPPELGG